MKLKIEHLAPYLPYGLKVLLTESNKTAEIFVLNKILFRHQIQIQTIYGTYGDMYFKPILRSLSDLTKEIEHNGERFIPLYKMIKEDKSFTADFIHAFGYEELKVSVYELLLEYHFDVFGLIEAGLAIDINTAEIKI